MNPETKMDHNNESLSLGKIRLNKVLSVRNTDKKEQVYDLKVTSNENYVTSVLGLVHNGGKRSGAGTIALPIWHNDIQDFLDIQSEHGDLRLKAYDIFPQVTVPDIFMERDKNKGSWTTFCPYEVKKKLGIDVRGLYGPEFTVAYLKIEEAAANGKLAVSRKIENARDLMKIIMRTQFDTGLPYIAFTDTINEYNPNKNDNNGHIGIPCSNLCLSADSTIEIMADNQFPCTIRIDEFVTKFESDFYIDPVVKTFDIATKLVVWSPVTRAMLVSETDDMMCIESADGKHKIECTPDHMIYTENRSWVKASDLLETDQLNFLSKESV